jgi:hypothetical protein
VEGILQIRLFEDPALSSFIEDIAQQHQVVSAIHAEDFIFHYLLNSAADRMQAVQQYFLSGRESAVRVAAICKQHRPPPMPRNINRLAASCLVPTKEAQSFEVKVPRGRQAE